MRHRRGGRIPTRLALALALVLASLAGAALGQQAGHGTLPATGAAAPGALPTAARDTDPVLAKIEVLRRSLGELAKQYKKAKRDEPLRAEVLHALERAEGEVGAAREKLGRDER